MARRWLIWLIAFVALTTFVILLPVGFALFDGCSWRCAWSWVDWWFSGSLFLLVLAWLFAAPLILFLSFKRRGNLVPITFSLTAEGVRLESSKSRSELFWKTLERLVKSKKGLALYLSRSHSIMIPRRAFNDDIEFEAFADTAVERWKQHHTS
jgi:hypothetical protein